MNNVMTGMITEIKQDGIFIKEAGIDGERRADGAWPAMIDALQLSKDRWLVIYSTRGFCGVDQGFRGRDNDHSILWQLRRDSALGTVIKEGIFARYAENWDVLGDGKSNFKQHCHTGGFGVPKGALVRGKRVPHENLFAVSWYRSPRGKGDAPGQLATEEYERRLYEAAFRIEWAQFRLADSGDDIEIVQPPQQLRQKGYESGPAFCSMTPICPMNKWYVKPAPYTDDRSEWVQVPHFRDGIAAIRFQFSPASKRYEWVQTGPLFSTGRQDGLTASTEDGLQLTETSVIRHLDGWLILARSAERLSKKIRGVAWIRTDDPFKRLPDPHFPGTPFSKSPCSAFRCPDGVIRVFTNDMTLSPYRDDRNPLYCWDVDPDDGFKTSNPRVVFDAMKAGLPVREESWPRIDMPNLFPHAGGKEQIIAYRARLRQRKSPHTRLVDEEKRRTGAYHGRICYSEEFPGAWEFGS
jgi:hypothetical protein